MRSNRLPLLVVALASVAVASCSTLTSSSTGNAIAVGGMGARTKGNGFTTLPQISFYRASGASFVTINGLVDSCIVTAYADSTASGGTAATIIGAGDFLVMQIGASTDTLRRAGGTTDPTYQSTKVSGMSFVPGDSMVITVPGERGGFPASTFRGKTAEAFTSPALVPPPVGSPIPLTWTPPADANTGMFVTFRYAAGNATAFNRQISCSFVDDGSASVPAVAASEWLAATKRDYIMQRVRVILAQVDVPLSYFNIISTYDVPTPISP